VLGVEGFVARSSTYLGFDHAAAWAGPGGSLGCVFVAYSYFFSFGRELVWTDVSLLFSLLALLMR
jgi:hypothetical protein